jgi:hypothetical protein
MENRKWISSETGPAAGPWSRAPDVTAPHFIRKLPGPYTDSRDYLTDPARASQSARHTLPTAGVSRYRHFGYNLPVA